MRLIDADKLGDKIFRGSYWNNADGDIFFEMVESEPTVEEALIPVRCKSCKCSGMYCFGDSSIEKLACLDIEDDGFIRCAKSVNPDDFCSFGEPR